MKLRIASLTLLLVALVAVPAMAQDIYDNGPTNGNTDAWTVNFGFTVSDTFTTTLANTQITGVTFAAWMAPGDILDSAEISITSSEAGGTSYFDQTVNFTQAGCVGNQYGYNVCNESSTFTGPVLASAGSYWLNIQNASSAAGDPVYWDENSGPSSASENTVGTIPSESFTVLGTQSTTTTSTTTTGTTPEPSSIVLLGSGILGLAGVLRRKLF